MDELAPVLACSIAIESFNIHFAVKTHDRFYLDAIVPRTANGRFSTLGRDSKDFTLCHSLQPSPLHSSLSHSLESPSFCQRSGRLIAFLWRPPLFKELQSV